MMGYKSLLELLVDKVAVCAFKAFCVRNEVEQ